MPTLFSLRALASVFLLVLPGCPAAGPAEKRMQKVEVIRLARKTFECELRGGDPATWSAKNLDVRFVSLKGRATWIVSLPKLASDSVGGPSVYIDDETGKADFELGA